MSTHAHEAQQIALRPWGEYPTHGPTRRTPEVDETIFLTSGDKLHKGVETNRNSGNETLSTATTTTISHMLSCASSTMHPLSF